MATVLIKCVSKKARVIDRPSGVEWAGNGDVQQVDARHAARLLHHTDVWEPAETGMAPVVATEASDTKAPEDLEEGAKTAEDQQEIDPTTLPPLVDLENMSADDLRAYAQQNFGHTFHHNTGEATMRKTLIALMNRE